MILAADVADYPRRWGHMSEQSVKNSAAAAHPGAGFGHFDDIGPAATPTSPQSSDPETAKVTRFVE